jgi:hypothetical protein
MMEEPDTLEYLLSMASTLCNSNQENFQSFDSQPHKVSEQSSSKPSTDVLYIDTKMFSNRMPKTISGETCNCAIKCTGKTAVRQCFSCSLYETRGNAYYCQDCFDFTHPWYRVTHYHSIVSSEDDILYHAKLSQQDAQIKKCEQEGKHFLSLLQNKADMLKRISEDEIVERKMKSVGRKLIEFETEIKKFQLNLQDKEKYSIEQILATIMIQKLYRGKTSQKIASKMCLDRYLYVWDSKNSRCE